MSEEQNLESRIGFPDYKRFTRTGDGGRILDVKGLKDSPKIVCPILVFVKVILGRTRGGVELSLQDSADACRTALEIPSELIIDVLSTRNMTSSRIKSLDEYQSSDVVVSLRDYPLDPLPKTKKHSARFDVHLQIYKVVDTSEDANESRRSALESMISSSSDSVALTVPMTWIIPDSTFKPKAAVLPLFPTSVHMLFLKSAFGSVTRANVVFEEGLASSCPVIGAESLAGRLVTLVVQFKEHRSLCQAVMSLHERYLLNPKSMANPMLFFTNCRACHFEKFMTTIKPSNDVAVNALSGPANTMTGPANTISAGPSSLTSVARDLRQKRKTTETDESFRTGPGSSGDTLSGDSEFISLSDSTEKGILDLLTRVELLEKENERLLGILNEPSSADGDAQDGKMASREIPADGLPPWKLPRTDSAAV